MFWYRHVCRVYYKVALIGIMVCAGPWCPKLVEPLGLKLPLKACDMWTHIAWKLFAIVLILCYYILIRLTAGIDAVLPLFLSKRQHCIGPGNNHSSLQRLHVSSCMCAPFIILYTMNQEFKNFLTAYTYEVIVIIFFLPFFWWCLALIGTWLE